MKKYFTYLFCLIFLVTQSGCLTARLYGYEPHVSRSNSFSFRHIKMPEYNKTTDIITDFLLDEKKERIVAIGQKYHYTFDFNKDNLNHHVKYLLPFLTWEKRDYLKLLFSSFTVKDKNTVSGYFYIEIDEKNQKLLTEKDLQFFEKLGINFYFASDGTLRHKDDPSLGYTERSVSHLEISGDVLGTRNLPQDMNVQFKKLSSKFYTIDFNEKNTLITDEITNQQIALRLLLTPLTTTIDLISLPLFLIIGPFVILRSTL